MNGQQNMLRIRYSYTDGKEIEILEYISILNCLLSKQDVVVKLFRIHKEWINSNALLKNNCIVLDDKSRNDSYYLCINQIEKFDIFLELLSTDAFEYPAEIECYLLDAKYTLDSISHNCFEGDISKSEYKIKISNYHDFIDVRIDTQFYCDNKKNIDDSLIIWETNNGNMYHKTISKIK